MRSWCGWWWYEQKKKRGRVQWVRERDESFWIQLFFLLLLCAVMNMLNAMQHETRLDTKPKLLFFNCIFHLILLSIGGNRIKETQMANLLVLLCYFVRISSTMSILLYKLFRLLPPLIIHDRQVAFQRAIKVKAKTLTKTQKKKPRGLLIRLFLLFEACKLRVLSSHSTTRSGSIIASDGHSISMDIHRLYILCDDTAGLLRPDRERDSYTRHDVTCIPADESWLVLSFAEI